MELVLGNIDRFRKIMESYLYKYSEDPLDWVDYSKSLQKYSLHGTALSILQQAYKKAYIYIFIYSFLIVF